MNAMNFRRLMYLSQVRRPQPTTSKESCCAAGQMRSSDFGLGSFATIRLGPKCNKGRCSPKVDAISWTSGAEGKLTSRFPQHSRMPTKLQREGTACADIGKKDW